MAETEQDIHSGRHRAGTATSAPASCLCVVDSGIAAQAERLAAQALGGAPTLVRTFRQLRQEPWFALRLVFRRFDVALAYVTDVEHLYRDLILTYLWVLRARQKALCDVRGGRIIVDAATGVRAFYRCLADLAVSPLLYSRARWAAAVRFRSRRRGPGGRPGTDGVAYLRANLWQESRAGGSVAHTTGVVAGLSAAGIPVRYVATARLHRLDGFNIEVHLVPSQVSRLRNVPDLPFAAYGEVFAQRAYAFLRDRPPAFVYQRYAILNLSGADLARLLGRPFVLEYNGSEVWVARHWGSRLIFEGLAERVERANLAYADLIVVVSGALRDELQARGIPAERILVNPNGVDPDRYSPACDGLPVRRRSGLEAKLIIGFVGTFGPWHGAEVLAQAIRAVVERLPRAHFLFVGDGSRMATVQAIVARDGVESCTTFAGLVPQDEAPAYLAACDILVSPHVPNPDGSRFFGSPTKLFEYMAMGKGIVASDLEQIGEVLAHDRTAWLVRPGDVEDLVAGIVALGSDPEARTRLGAAARAEAVERYTWDAHVRRLLGRMEDLGLLSPGRKLP